MELRVCGVAVTHEELLQLHDLVTSPAWRGIMTRVFELDKKFSESLLLDHGCRNDKSDGYEWKLKTDKELGFQLGLHKMATKYLGLERTVQEAIKKSGGN
jgi:hypothetical protein